MCKTYEGTGRFCGIFFMKYSNIVRFFNLLGAAHSQVYFMNE